jgi:Rap1a immunity proteins
MRTAALLAIVGVLLATDVSSGSDKHSLTAYELAQMCQGRERNDCNLYVHGVLQGIAVGLDMADGRARSGRPCVPKSVSNDQVEAGVIKNLIEVTGFSAQYRDEETSNFLGMIMGSKFPCPRAAH